MAARVGPSPFSGKPVDIRDEGELAALRRKNRQYKGKRFVEYDEDTGLAINSGYRKKPKAPPMKKLTGPNGEITYTPDVIDFDDWLEIFRIKTSDTSAQYEESHLRKSCKNLADLADYVFNVTKSKFESVDCVGGHILSLDYSPYFHVLRAHFATNGAVAAYFFVPKGVAGTLMNLATNPHTRPGADGKERHLVGIYFWDLIRVRGTIHGNRYDCCYVSDGGGYSKAPAMQAAEYSHRRMKEAAELRSRASELARLGETDAAEGLVSAARDAEEEAKQAARDNKKNEPSSDGYVTMWNKRLETPQESAAFDVLRGMTESDPRHPVSVLMQKVQDPVDEDEVAGSRRIFDRLVALMLKRGEGLKSESMRNEFLAEGKKRKGDLDEMDGYARQEEYLVKKGLWPPWGIR